MPGERAEPGADLVGQVVMASRTGSMEGKSRDQLGQQVLAHLAGRELGQLARVGFAVLVGGCGEEELPRAGQDPGEAVVRRRYRGGLKGAPDILPAGR